MAGVGRKCEYRLPAWNGGICCKVTLSRLILRMMSFGWFPALQRQIPEQFTPLSCHQPVVRHQLLYVTNVLVVLKDSCERPPWCFAMKNRARECPETGFSAGTAKAEHYRVLWIFGTVFSSAIWWNRHWLRRMRRARTPGSRRAQRTGNQTSRLKTACTGAMCFSRSPVLFRLSPCRDPVPGH
jgi:hypothetical protein